MVNPALHGCYFASIGMRYRVYSNIGFKFEMYSKSRSAHHTNFVNITLLTITQRKFKKSLASKPLLVASHPWWFFESWS